MAKRPSDCCRSCTTSCGDWPRRKLGQEQPGQTLQATGLVHEAYVRLVDVEKQSAGTVGGTSSPPRSRRCGGSWSRTHSKRRLKRGRGRQRLDLDQLTAGSDPASDDLLALDEALTKLAIQEPSKAELSSPLRYFAGFTIDEAAELLGISRTTAKRIGLTPRSGCSRKSATPKILPKKRDFFCTFDEPLWF